LRAFPCRHVDRVVATVAGLQAQLPLDALLTTSENSIASAGRLLKSGAATARGFGRAAVLAAVLNLPAGATKANVALEDKNVADALGIGAWPLLALLIRGARLRFDPVAEGQGRNQNKNDG
jgi:hypothetical protein